jgi:hypothetical protein
VRPETLAAIEVKPKEEILERLTQLIQRHRRKYLNRFLRPCPENCKLAAFERNRVSGCTGCDSSNPESCRDESLYLPIAVKQQLYDEFSNMLQDPEILLREYRDIAMLLWVIGEFDTEPHAEIVA